MGDKARHGDLRVLVCAPYGQDASTLTELLGQHGYRAIACATLADVAEQIDEQVGLVLVTEEALEDLDHLREALAAQPPWSDIPFIVLAARQTGAYGATVALRTRLSRLAVNAVVLERPLGATSLISAAGSAMHARRRQFDLRDRLNELDAQNHRLGTLLQHVPIGVAFIKSDGTTMVSNPAFRRFRPDDSQPFPRAVPQGPDADSDDAAVHDAVLQALDGARVVAREIRLALPNGDPLWTRVNAIALTPTSADHGGAVAVIVDVDTEKRAQIELADAAAHLEDLVRMRTAELEHALVQLRDETSERERAEASLRQSQKMEAVGQLTGGIAHDFNNMLTGIMGSLDLLRRRLAAGRLDGADRYITAASTSATRAAAVTQRLLAFSRRQSLDSKPVEINQLIEGMSDLIERALNEHIAFELALAPDLPTGIVDPNQLESAILNLAINARDAMPEGGVLTIETRIVDLVASAARLEPGMSPGRYVIVAVSDTGVGMPAELLEKVFDPFFTTKPLGQGTGLGLSMVYGFARQSGGQVRIHSQVGAGTSVKLYLPATEAMPAPGEVQSPAVVPGEGERVLIVEDDAAVRLLVKEVLRELNYEAVEYADPLLALPYLKSGERIDLLISDVGLPQMNGRELAEIARHHRPDLPILFITGYAENAAIRSEFLGANMAMVTKPFSIDVLAAKIGEMLRPIPSSR